MFNFKSCPFCHSTETFQRTGVHFEHERYCGKCANDYDPNEEYIKYLEQDKERVEMNTHKE
jgi:hypothetical protein